MRTNHITLLLSFMLIGLTPATADMATASASSNSVIVESVGQYTKGQRIIASTRMVLTRYDRIKSIIDSIISDKDFIAAHGHVKGYELILTKNLDAFTITVSDISPESKEALISLIRSAITRDLIEAAMDEVEPLLAEVENLKELKKQEADPMKQKLLSDLSLWLTDYVSSTHCGSRTSNGFE